MTDTTLDRAQHFLIDEKALEKEISEAKLSKKDKVIEIGAGTGVLTSKLAENAGKVLAFEIDEKFKPELEALKEKYPNLEVVYGNALEHDWKGYNKIVSNIPYFLIGDIILKAIKINFQEIVIIAGEKFRYKTEMNEDKIGIIVNLFYNTEILMKVSPSSFMPEPKTDSWLLRLTLKKKSSEKESILKRILQKSGKIKNAILYSLVEKGKTKNEAREIIEKMNLTKDILEKPVEKITGNFILRLKDEIEKVIKK